MMLVLYERYRGKTTKENLKLPMSAPLKLKASPGVEYDAAKTTIVKTADSIPSLVFQTKTRISPATILVTVDGSVLINKQRQ